MKLRKSQGCICVDMECSAIAALAQFREKGIFHFSYAADNLDCEKWARGNNITRLELSVICSNEVARHIYEKNGFEIEGIKRDAMIIYGKYVDEYYMLKLYKD